MEPITTALAAFAAVQKAVSLIKEASQTAQDVASLGPLIGNYFDAKHQAVKAVKETKKAGGSNLGKAIEIELALKAQADFEEQLKGLFFPNNMDVWESIQERVRAMDQEDKIAARAARDRAKRIQEEKDEMVEIIVVVLAVVLLFGMVGFGMYMIYDTRQPAKWSAKK
jgi:cell division septum initiation protein DivIVA